LSQSTTTATPATYTVAEAAQLLGVHEQTVRAAIAHGDLPVLRLGRRQLIPRAQLDELLAPKRTTP
jgi:excisionase family DNA binding protein